MSDTPILVDPTPAPAQATAAFRQLLLLAAGALVSRGVFGAEYTELAVGAVTAIGTFAWGQRELLGPATVAAS